MDSLVCFLFGLVIPDHRNAPGQQQSVRTISSLSGWFLRAPFGVPSCIQAGDMGRQMVRCRMSWCLPAWAKSAVVWRTTQFVCE
jgi:hypothetical protein